MCRLTAAKEDGATIEIDGKKVALGIPGALSAKGSTGSQPVPPLIPLGRAGTTEDAAGSVLLYVPSSHCSFFGSDSFSPGVCSLASPLASFVSGHTLEVTGGQGI